MRDLILAIIQCGLWTLLGGALGSFAGCAAYRLPRGLSLLPRSRCPACGAPIPWFRNIPVLSWLFSAAIADCCGAPISPHYLAYEMVGAAAGFLSWALRG